MGEDAGAADAALPSRRAGLRPQPAEERPCAARRHRAGRFPGPPRPEPKRPERAGPVEPRHVDRGRGRLLRRARARASRCPRPVLRRCRRSRRRHPPPGPGREADRLEQHRALYNPTPLDRDAIARTVLRPEVGCHFFRGEGFTYDWFGELEPIRCPSLILAGALDPITTLADHDELAEAIRGSRLEVFADAGHGVFRDKPEEALSVIREFVAAPS